MASSSNSKTIRLKSNDRMEFVVSEAVARQSRIICRLIEDNSAPKTIPLPNVSGKTLKKVIQYCKQHETTDEGSSRRMSDKELKNWEQDFLDVDTDTLYDLAMAANYLEISQLLHSTCKKVADMIKEKSPEEIRTIFNIVNDFHPGEQDQIRRENRWAREY